MRLKKPIIFSVIGLCVVGIILFFIVKGNNNKYKYYYTFTDDGNLASQTIKIYDNANDIKGNYSVFYNDVLVASTASQSASIAKVLCDLEKHPIVVIQFKNSEKKYEVVYKKG